MTNILASAQSQHIPFIPFFSYRFADRSAAACTFYILAHRSWPSFKQMLPVLGEKIAKKGSRFTSKWPHACYAWPPCAGQSSPAMWLCSSGECSSGLSASLQSKPLASPGSYTPGHDLICPSSNHIRLSLQSIQQI